MNKGFTVLVFIAMATIGLSAAYSPEIYDVTVVSSGLIACSAVEVTADLSRTIALNNLSLGTQIHGWDNFAQNQILMQKTSQLGLKLVRMFASSDKALDPCV